MEILSGAPVRATSLLWQPQAGAFALSIICKATFRLVPGVAELAAEQENPSEEDNYWNDDPTRSLYAPSDLVPYKPRADVLLVGYAFAPRGEPARSVVARLVVGTIDKAIEVFCDRSWAPDGSLREGPRFSRMPLRYERAAGGPDTSNPVGMRLYATDAYGAIAIPNLQPPGMHLSQRGEWVPPIAFGPLAPTWPARLDKLGAKHAAWAQSPRFDKPLPEGLDARFFHAAPDDQQTSSIRPNERIVIENLHPEHPRLVTSLPNFSPRCVVERAGGTEEVGLEGDTLWIDTDSARCTVVWRGRISLSHPNERGRILLTMNERGGPARSLTPVARPAAAPPQSAPQPAAPLGPDSDDAMTTLVGTSNVQASVLPFVRNAEAPPAPAFTPPPAQTAKPFPAPPAPAPAPPAPAPASPWAMGAPARFEPAPPPPPAVTPKPPSAVAEGARLGVAGASTAAASAERAERPERAERAAEPAPRVSPQISAAPAREAMTLLWLEESRMEAILAEQQWVSLLSESEIEESEPSQSEDEEEIDYTTEEEDDEPESVKQRRRVGKILARGEPSDGPGLALGVANAVTKNGTLEPPIMLASGDLSFPFEAWETLRVLMIAATPTALLDKKLKEILDGITETTKIPGIERSSSIAEGLATRVRDAFAQSNRQLGVSWLDAQAERMLLEGRCYQKRSVLGQTFLRCLLHAPGAEEGIPTYLPESLNKTLPLVTKMRARVVAEVHAQQDQYETYPRSLRVLALGHLIDLGASKSR